MSVLDRILAKQQSRKKRMDTARAAVKALTPEEREEILAEMAMEFDEDIEIPAPEKPAPPAKVPTKVTVPMSVRAMIVSALRDSTTPLRTHEIFLATKAKFPGADINKNTVAAAVHRLATQKPPLLIVRGTDERVPAYVFDESALNSTNGTPGIQ